MHAQVNVLMKSALKNITEVKDEEGSGEVVENSFEMDFIILMVQVELLPRTTFFQSNVYLTGFMKTCFPKI